MNLDSAGGFDETTRFSGPEPEGITGLEATFDPECAVIAQTMMALGRFAPLLRSPDVWSRVEGLDSLLPVLDLRNRLELDLRVDRHGADGGRAGMPF